MIANYAGIASLIAGVLIILAFAFLLANRFPKKSTAQITPMIYKFRTKYFYVLSAAVVICSYLALTNTPYPCMRQEVDIDAHVTVVGQKWLWHLHNGPYSEEVLDSSTSDSIFLPMSKNIEFHVTAPDVNHGFGVYDDKGVLMAQTQAMPGHVNRLLMSFEKPGTYKILCMEYCGVGHHVMQEFFIVK